MTSIRCFVPLEKIGEGSFATVYKVKRISDNSIYALKKIKMTKLSLKAKECSLNEVRLLASLSSPYITKYYQAFFDQTLQALCIVMEYASKGDLRKLISQHKQENKKITQLQIWRVMIHLLYGLKMLHDNNILHRDMKCQNIFIFDEVYKIGDMNVSKINKHGFVDTQTGTPYYASPEVWKDQPYNQKSDIWSLGCVLYEMTTFRPPFMGNGMHQLYKNIVKGSYPAIPQCYSYELGEIIKSCLRISPQDRPNINQLLSNYTVKIYQNFCLKDKIHEAKLSVEMLKTISLPKDIKELNKLLPKSNYKSAFYEPIIQQDNEQIKIIENFAIGQIKETKPSQKDRKNQLKMQQINKKEVNIEGISLVSQSRLYSIQQCEPQHSKIMEIIPNHAQIKYLHKITSKDQIDHACAPQSFKSEDQLLKIKTIAKNIESFKKKRRVFKEIQVQQIKPKTRSKSLPRTESRNRILSQQIQSQKQAPKMLPGVQNYSLNDKKSLSKDDTDQNLKARTESKKQLSNLRESKYWKVVEQAKKYLQKSIKKNKRIF